MKKKIVTDMNILKQISSEVKFQGVEPENCEYVDSIIKDLEDSLDTSRGVGLSAIQIEVPIRVSIVRYGETKMDLINPKILKKEGRIKFPGERCLSLPGITLDTARYKHIVIENGNGQKYSLDGMMAIIIQHEVDHMDGKTMLDKKWRRK